jgi:methyl-accepting chemotaxis protein
MAQMDQATQQNSALVEENAASAKTLENQAAAMDERIGCFRLADAPPAAPERRPRAAAVPHLPAASPRHHPARSARR